jgi:hypothetical protein
LFLVSLFVLAVSAMSFGQAQKLAFSDYLDAMPNWWASWPDPATDRVLNFDVWGKLAIYRGLDLGTEVDGRITVRPLADGRAYVTIMTKTKNAICWGGQGDGTGYITGIYLHAFGYTPPQIVNGAEASLGDGMTIEEFIMPSPDSSLYDMYPYERVSTVINCSGQLRYGSGYPDGTPGRAHTTQEGLYSTGVPSGCPAGDCWPTERVDFFPVGK